MRLSTLLWRDDGKTQTEIAHLLGICTRTVRNWLRLYRQKGLDALCTLHYRGRSRRVDRVPGRTTPRRNPDRTLPLRAAGAGVDSNQLHDRLLAQRHQAA